MSVGFRNMEGALTVLVLSRKVNEKVVLSGGITLTIVEVRGDKIRLGIEAPKDVSVHRSEVAERIGFEGRKPSGEQPLVAPEDCGMPTKGLGI